jgi:holo-[acyl-carrier protein] synthase
LPFGSKRIRGSNPTHGRISLLGIECYALAFANTSVFIAKAAWTNFVEVSFCQILLVGMESDDLLGAVSPFGFTVCSMVLGVGIDSVSVDEIREQIEGIDGYLQEVFTSGEIQDCRERANPYASFAARFAAKEAFMKAAGTGWTDEIDFLEIETRSDGRSRPTMQLSEKARTALAHISPFSIHVSLVHSGPLASAIVVLDR